MRRAVPIPAVLAVAILLLLVVGLTLNPHVAPQASATLSVPPLSRVGTEWRAPNPVPYRDPFAVSDVFAWSTGVAPSDGRSGDRVTLIADRSLVQRDAETGAVAWRLALPGAVCGTAARPGRDTGVVALSRHEQCDEIVAVDLRSGAIRWRRAMGTYRYDEVTALDVAGGVVGVAGRGSALRLDARTGRTLSTYGGEEQESCLLDFTVGHGVLVGSRRCEGDDASSTISALDLDSGRRLLERRTTEGSEPVTVVARSPLIVAAQRFGERGVLLRLDTPGPDTLPIGRQIGDPKTRWWAAMIGGRLVATYDGLPALLSYDPDTGEQVAAQPMEPLEYVLGARDGRVLTATVSRPGIPGPDAGALLARDPSGEVPATALGSIEVSDLVLATGGVGSALLGDRLLTLPSDLDQRVLLTLSVPDQGRPLRTPPHPWAPDEIRPEEAADVRNHVSSTALARAGISAPADPPADGRYVTFSEDGYSSRVALTSVSALLPTSGVGDHEAVGSATRAARGQIRAIGGSGMAHRAPGLGDEAWITDRDPVTGTGCHARLANVLVDVLVSTDDLGPQRERAAARTICADLLQRLDEAGGGTPR